MLPVLILLAPFTFDYYPTMVLGRVFGKLWLTAYSICWAGYVLALCATATKLVMRHGRLEELSAANNQL
jgi:hypothetical protein